MKIELKLLTMMWVAWPLLSQTDALLSSAGYAAPAPLEVAPGQIVTLFFRGITPAPTGFLRAGQAISVPIPERLAGLSAAIHQLPQTTPFRLPILAVKQQNECEEVVTRPVCLLTAIRVQIPSELTAVVAKLTIDVDGVTSRTFLVRPIRDNARVLTDCDPVWDTNPGRACNRLAFHSDGTVVDATAPAKLGETLVIYAYGLGPTLPRVPAGRAAPEGTVLIDSTMRQLNVTFSVFRNAVASLPRYPATEIAGENAVRYAGLTPGQVGLYQMNVQVPASLEIPIRCGGDTRSNVLAKVVTAQGVENLPLCVE